MAGGRPVIAALSDPYVNCKGCGGCRIGGYREGSITALCNPATRSDTHLRCSGWWVLVVLNAHFRQNRGGFGHCKAHRYLRRTATAVGHLQHQLIHAVTVGISRSVVALGLENNQVGKAVEREVVQVGTREG